MQASWKERLVPAHWQVELGLVPLVSRSVFRGGCGIRTTLISLSTDGWGFVPNSLVLLLLLLLLCWVFIAGSFVAAHKLLFIAAHELLIAVAFLVAEYRLQ